MATTQEVTPNLPLAADPEYSVEQMNQMIRVIEWFIRQQTGVTLGRFSGLYLPGLPTDGSGLRAGQVFNNGGILTIVTEDGPMYLGGVSATLSLGSVTVVV